jgi:polyphosphate glucokinase
LVLNDADAAGTAEMKFGVGCDNKGVAFLITVGTGLGTVLFKKKKLIPNMELGHVYMPNGREAEEYCSDATRKNEDLSWEAWGERFNEYLVYMEKLLYPDIFVIGGGVSKKMDRFSNTIKVSTPVLPAQLLNEAGLIGAAVAAKNIS